MKKEDFTRLKTSIREAGKIKRGIKVAVRETVFELPRQAEGETLTHAFCVKTDDPALLILCKLYPVTLYGERYVKVIDEAGEATIYPADFF
jgi:hypothetical protein